MENIPVLFSQKEIAACILDMAEKINRDYKNKSDIVLLSVLKGSLIFTADLIRFLQFGFELCFIEISSYRLDRTSGQILAAELTCDLKGKNILILEDIIDTGNSLQYLISLIEHQGIQSLNIATLLIKKHKFNLSKNVRYAGFEIPDHFVVGYGMDFAGKYRNLPYIGTID